ncbi:MAG: hypothetical protein HQK76_12730 [Desulfobacterales bacterium]|nr:hypothetical protein [Desulfobacterales bacterium]
MEKLIKLTQLLLQLKNIQRIADYNREKAGILCDACIQTLMGMKGDVFISSEIHFSIDSIPAEGYLSDCLKEVVESSSLYVIPPIGNLAAKDIDEDWRNYLKTVLEKRKNNEEIDDHIRVEFHWIDKVLSKVDLNNLEWLKTRFKAWEE